MKKLLLFMILTIIVYSGGDIKVVTPYETNDEIKADEEAVEYVADEVIPLATPYFQEEIVVEPTPVVVVAETPPPPPPTPVVEIPREVKKPKDSNGINPSGFYAGLGISGSRYGNRCECDKATGTIKRYNHKENSVAIVARVGYDYNQYIGLEARGIKDFAEDEKASITHAGGSL